MGLFGKSKVEVARQTRLEETRRSQAAAADPATSAWVSANAGTGRREMTSSKKPLRMRRSATSEGTPRLSR